MKVAFIIYNGMTALDFVGVFDPITRLKTMRLMPNLEWEICSRTKAVNDNAGLCFSATQVDKPLSDYDMLVVPGGFGTRTLVNDPQFIEWLHSGSRCMIKASVCTGSLLLGAAGFLKGKRATCHPDAYHLLKKYCDIVVEDRIVDDGEVITARGVTSSIDLGLYLCEKIAGGKAKETIRRQMDYHYFKRSRCKGEDDSIT